MEQKTIINTNFAASCETMVPSERTRSPHNLRSIPDRSELVVIGGGVAGLVSSIVLARQGFQVLLCEKKSYPRDKVCGACLNANALATLEKLQLTSILDRLGAPSLQHVQIQCGPRTVTLPLPTGRAITRRELDLALADEASRCGVTILENVSASLDSLSTDQRFRIVKIQNTEESRNVEASLVLVAAGLGGVRESTQSWPAQVNPNSKIGLGLNLHTISHNIQSHTIHLCVRPNGYLGIVQAEQNQLNLAAAVHPKLLKQESSFGAWVRETLNQYHLHIDYPLEEAQWRGTPTLTRRIARPFGRRWLAIGDSAGYVEPFTGEGMAWAMAGGSLAATLAAQNLSTWTEDNEVQWGKLYQQMIRHRQLSCRSLAWLLQNSFRSRLAMELATWFPGIGRWLIQDINRMAEMPSLPIAPPITK